MWLTCQARMLRRCGDCGLPNFKWLAFSRSGWHKEPPPCPHAGVFHGSPGSGR